ncbi:hypothetical protein EDB83DRAFT_2435033, partial [Lactarius deliciosus]
LDLHGFVCLFCLVYVLPTCTIYPFLPSSLLRSPFLHHAYYVSLIPLPTPIHLLIPYGHIQAFECTHGVSLTVTGYLSPTVLHPYLRQPSITILLTIRQLHHIHG